MFALLWQSIVLSSWHGQLNGEYLILFVTYAHCSFTGFAFFLATADDMNTCVWWRDCTEPL